MIALCFMVMRSVECECVSTFLLLILARYKYVVFVSSSRWQFWQQQNNLLLPFEDDNHECGDMNTWLLRNRFARREVKLRSSTASGKTIVIPALEDGDACMYEASIYDSY